MDKNLRIVFMGTPEFAVPSLEILIDNGWNVVAVITAPDKPQGRGRKLKGSPVKEAAEKHHIPVLQPTNLKSPEFLEELASYQSDIQVVVAFRMLPEKVWNMPPKGTFNLHASLLPNYRGAAPINWAIINGEEETGVTTFFLKHEIDTGSILFQEKERILKEDNAGSLYGRLMYKGATLVLKTMEAISSDRVHLTVQDESQAENHAPKIFKEDCQIHWDKTAEEVHNHVRGLSPHPAAWTVIKKKTCKIYATAITSKKAANLDAGEYLTDGKEYLYFQTADEWISVLEIQMEGKKRMGIQDFLRGNKL